MKGSEVAAETHAQRVVRTGQHSAFHEACAHGVLNERVAVHVDGGGGFVHHQHARLAQQRPTHAQQLPLPEREVRPFVNHLHVQLLAVRLDNHL